MQKWLKVFAIIFNILLVCSGIGCGGCAITFLVFACNKNIYSYKLDDQTTVSSLFEEMGVASKKELLGILGCATIYCAIVIAMFVFLTKWFKKAYQTGNPFSEDLVKLLRKTSKYMILASLIGYVVEAIILSAVGVENYSSSYGTMLFGGLLATCIGYILAYASVKLSQKEPTENIEESVEKIEDKKE